MNLSQLCFLKQHYPLELLMMIKMFFIFCAGWYGSLWPHGASKTKELNFSIYLILMNLHLSSYVWLVANTLDSIALKKKNPWNLIFVTLLLQKELRKQWIVVKIISFRKWVRFDLSFNVHVITEKVSYFDTDLKFTENLAELLLLYL